MELSRRLRAVAALVPPGAVLADVGTDHAYVPVHLVREGIIPRAVAMDINAGPLERARHNIEAAHLTDRIETRLGDGLSRIQPGEVTCACIAGMGGPLTLRILQNSPATAAACSSLVLQPQSDLRQVRFWLMQNGLPVEQEDMVCEDGKYYPMMRVKVCPDSFPSSPRAREALPETAAADDETELACRFGPRLLAGKHPVLAQFLTREEALLHAISLKLAPLQNERSLERKKEIEEDLRLVRLALQRF